MSDTSTTAAAPARLRDDATTIGLVGLAHGTSHFFHLLLPPLFPLFIRDFGLSYAELGLLVSTFFVISGVGQALAGFVVDRFGARPVLMLAMLCFASAGVAAALAPGYAGLMLAAMLAGLGNAPFHPADFTILNKRVSPRNLGHAFSVHGITGNLGWAAAPVFLTGLTALSGSWRVATAGASVWALLVLAVLWWQRAAIDDRAAGLASASKQAAAAVPGEHPLAFLRLPSVWLCFSFFFWTTCALSAIQSFASPALQQLYGLSLELTSFIVTGFMLFGAAGMVMGGFLVGKAERLERLIALCLMASAGVLCLVATGLLPGPLAMVVAASAGLGTGLAGPSRDMLIKRAAPPGATGRVYGTVYSGLDIGFALAAPAFGALMDHQHPSAVFWGAGLALLCGVGSAWLVGAGVARRRAALAT
ncbi:MFS transporter [Ideonella sp. 4Y16]|uniref:MFS transporter n=1 Tax=Ideonella alba TaxID=2824118 RepID=UPI001B393156|nr:MFS transporter [Ideonella alba]MBQ0946583.1 MFS transporter [Ideonella alba]